MFKMTSPTTAIIRIKRRIEDNPLDTLILNYKRFKYDDNVTQNTSTEEDTSSTNTDSTLFKFVGTLDKAENPLKYLKETRQINIKREQNEEKLNKIIDKIKNEQKDLSKENRLKIINCHRALNKDCDSNTDCELTETLDESLSSLSTTVIVDVESQITPVEPKQEENNNKYVYDIYFTTDNEQFNDTNFSFDLLQSIEPLDDLILNDDKYRDNDDEFIMSDDSDSNDENNWRNDYPDDEEFDNMNENSNPNANDDDDDVEFLNNIMKSKFKISNEHNNDLYELSSTDDDEYYDDDVALKYGKRYAQFKAREKDNDYDVSDNTDDDDDIYGSDRDQYYYNDDDDDDDNDNE